MQIEALFYCNKISAESERALFKNLLFFLLRRAPVGRSRKLKESRIRDSFNHVSVYLYGFMRQIRLHGLVHQGGYGYGTDSAGNGRHQGSVFERALRYVSDVARVISRVYHHGAFLYPFWTHEFGNAARRHHNVRTFYDFAYIHGFGMAHRYRTIRIQ